MCTNMIYVRWTKLRIFVAVTDLIFSSQGLYQSGFSYNMAISGKSFAALCENFPEYVPKVLN